MEWWTLVLHGLGLWFFGLMTGFNAGMSSALLKLSNPQRPNPQQPNQQDMAAILQMMNQQTPGGIR